MVRVSSLLSSYLQVTLIVAITAVCNDAFAAAVKVDRSTMSELSLTIRLDNNVTATDLNFKTISTKTTLAGSASSGEIAEDYHAICFAVPPSAEASLLSARLITSAGASAVADRIYLTSPATIRGMRIAKLMVPATVSVGGAIQSVSEVDVSIRFSGGEPGRSALSAGRLGPGAGWVACQL